MTPPAEVDHKISTAPEFELFERLGAGGMGEVFRARQTDCEGTSKWVALKTIRPELADQSEFQERFFQEARLTARLKHPNIVQVHGLFFNGPTPRMSLELVDGITIQKLIETFRARREPIPIEACCRIAEQILDALNYAHSFLDPVSGQRIVVVHRDLTPSNVMLSRSGIVKILDFGIAKPKSSTTTDQTLTQNPFGNPSYITPESIHGVAATPRTDIFQFGLLFFELLTLERPFGGSTPEERSGQMMRNALSWPREYRPEIPQLLEALILRCLRRTPKRRFRNAAELHRALKLVHPEEENSPALENLISNTGNSDPSDCTVPDRRKNIPGYPIRFTHAAWRTKEWFLDLLAGDKTNRKDAVVAGSMIALLMAIGVQSILKRTSHTAPIAASIPKVTWKHGALLHDISLPNGYGLNASEMDTLGLSPMACETLADNFRSFLRYLFTEPLLKSDATFWVKHNRSFGFSTDKYATLIATFLTDQKVSLLIHDLSQACGENPRLDAALKVLRGVREVLLQQKKLPRTKHDLTQTLLSGNSVYWPKDALSSFDNREKTVQNEILEAYRSIISSNPRIFQPNNDVRMFRISNQPSPPNCRELGDLFWTAGIYNGFINISHTQPNRTFVLIPASSKASPDETTDAGLVIQSSDQLQDSVFKDGFCLYGRNGGRLLYNKFWVPHAPGK